MAHVIVKYKYLNRKLQVLTKIRPKSTTGGINKISRIEGFDYCNLYIYTIIF